MKNKENILFFVTIVLFIVPLWLFPEIPSQDGPSHLAGAKILKEYNNEDAGIFREFYSIPKEAVPNWIGHVVLAISLNWISPETSEKIFLSGYVILFPVLFRYLLYGINPASTLLAFLSFPFIYNYLFHMGFYNFVWSIPLFFLVIGYWIRHRDNLSAVNVLVLSVMTLALYFSHIFSFALSGVTLGILEIWLTGYTVWTRAGIGRVSYIAEIFREILPRAASAIVAYLPSLVLAIFFVIQRKTLPIPTEHSFFHNFDMLLSLYSLVSFEWNEIWLTRIIAGCLYLCAGVFLFHKIRNRNIERYDGMIFVFLAFIILYFTFPDTLLVSPNGMSGGGFVKPRIGIYPMLFLIIWIGAQQPMRKLSMGVVSVVLASSIILLGMNIKKYDEFSESLQEYRSALDLIEPNSSVLPISFFEMGSDKPTDTFSLKVDPFRHASEIFSAKKNVVVLSHYEGNMGYFPTDFRENRNPFRVFGNFPGAPEKVDIVKYQEASNGHPDYVLLWMAPLRDSESWKRFPALLQVNEHFDLIFTSTPKGNMRLFQRKNIGI